VSGALVGPDGLARCPWAGQTPDYLTYHDTEWGRVVRGERELYERFTLEAFQSGLSWLTILRKREGFRAAFADFDPEAVARFDDHDVVRLMQDVAIVRNGAKIRAAMANARAVIALREHAGLDSLVWSFAPPARPRPEDAGDVPSSTPESRALAKALRANGFVFVGPTTAYASMQACGLVDDHLADCFVSTR
jgi:DNA-3-methyladenine glycosylase I